MLQTEFESLTGIYPDTILYRAAEDEYNRQTADGRDYWADKQTFCAAYKRNDDNLAVRIQSRANELLWRQEEQARQAVKKSEAIIERLKAENAALQERLDAANERLKELQLYADMLHEKLGSQPSAVLEATELPVNCELKAEMLDTLREMLDDEFPGKDIRTALISMDYLLIRMANHEA